MWSRDKAQRAGSIPSTSVCMCARVHTYLHARVLVSEIYRDSEELQQMKRIKEAEGNP